MRTLLTRVAVGIALLAAAVAISFSQSAGLVDILEVIKVTRAALFLRFCLVAAVSVGVCATGLWLPCLLLRQSTPARGGALTVNEEQGASAHLALVLSLSAAGAIISFVVCWTVSLFVFDDTGPGTLAIVMLAVAGLARFRNLLPLRQPRSDSVVLAIVSLFAVGLAFWHVGFTELPNKNILLFCFRWDLGFHVYEASLVGEHGLPLINLNGTPDEPFQALMHTGVPVLLSGLSHASGVSLYQAAQILWLLGYLCIGWTSLALLRSFRLAPDVRVFAAIAPFIWVSAAHLPVEILRGGVQGILDPDVAYLFRAFAGGTMYHNLPQLLSVAVMGVGLLCLSFFTTDSRRLRSLWAVALALVVSGWIKPSLAILFGPALLIWMVMRRCRAAEFLVVTLTLALGVFVYMLPSFLEDLPADTSWMVGPPRETILRGAGECFALLGAGALFAFSRIRSVLRSPRMLAKVDWGDLTLIAAAGGTLFIMLFLQKGSLQHHGNQWWGFLGCVVLLCPYAIAWCASDTELAQRAAAPRWLRWTGTLLVIVQMFGGLIYAVEYPRAQLRVRLSADADALEVAGQATKPGTTFLIDPAIYNRDTMVYLGRPLLNNRPKEYVPVHEAEQWWRLVVKGQLSDRALLSKRGAAIIHLSRAEARSVLEREGWVRERQLPGNWELWLNPNRSGS